MFLWIEELLMTKNNKLGLIYFLTGINLFNLGLTITDINRFTVVLLMSVFFFIIGTLNLLKD